MEIKNNTDISNLIASSISKLNISPANASAPVKKQPAGKIAEPFKEEKEDVKLVDDEKVSKSPVDYDEVKKYAEMVGMEVSEEDIKYGIIYGRSVIADYSA